MARILLAEDDNDMRMFLARALERAGHEVHSFGEGLSAFEELKLREVDLLLTDIVMPEMDGMEVLRQLRKNGFTNPVAMLTTSSDERDLVESLRNGAQGYLLKDMEPDQLVLALRDIVAGKTVVAPDLAPVLARVEMRDRELRTPGTVIPGVQLDDVPEFDNSLVECFVLNVLSGPCHVPGDLILFSRT